MPTAHLGPARAWSTPLVGAGLALSTSGDRVHAVPGAGDRFVEEQDRFLSAHGWEREGTRHGPIVVRGPRRPDDRR